MYLLLLKYTVRMPYKSYYQFLLQAIIIWTYNLHHTLPMSFFSVLTLLNLSIDPFCLPALKAPPHFTLCPHGSFSVLLNFFYHISLFFPALHLFLLFSHRVLILIASTLKVSSIYYWGGPWEVIKNCFALLMFVCFKCFRGHLKLSKT